MIETRPSDRTLVDRAAASFEAYRQGNRAAFDELISMTTPLLWHTARGQGLTREAAEDVLQTVWLNLLRNADSVRQPATIVKWLLTSTRREAWKVSSRERDAGLLRPSYDGEGEPTDDRATTPDQEPEALAMLSQRQQRLWRHVQRLPARCQVLIRVVAFADRPDYGEIARALGMPVGSIGPTRGRCLAKLRDILAHDPAWEL